MEVTVPHVPDLPIAQKPAAASIIGDPCGNLPAQQVFNKVVLKVFEKGNSCTNNRMQKFEQCDREETKDGVVAD